MNDGATHYDEQSLPAAASNTASTNRDQEQVGANEPLVEWWGVGGLEQDRGPRKSPFVLFCPLLFQGGEPNSHPGFWALWTR